MPFWSVARCPYHESFAVERLAAAGFTTLLPLVRTRGRILPLFSGYVFIKLFSEAGDGWTVARRTPGVVSLILFGDRPARVPTQEVDALRARMHDGVVTLPPAPRPRRFLKGERIKITAGPLQGLSGLHSGMTSHAREIVLLAVLGRQTKVAVNRALVEPL
jgi:transcriptional antiterminator RfaH